MSYVLGLNVEAQSDTTHGTLYLLTDGHGSTRALTTATGVIAAGQVFDYDGFGTALDFNASTADTVWQFGGDGSRDVATSFTYQLARWRNGFTFTQLDTFDGGNTDPSSLNRTAYVESNPVLGSDPTGHLSLGTTLAVGGTVATIGAEEGGLAEEALQTAQGLVSNIAQYEQQVESLAESVGDALPAEIQTLEGQLSSIVGNQQSTLQQAFGQGGTAVGQHFQQLGSDVQDIGNDVIDLARPAGSVVSQNATISDGLKGVGSQIDNIIRLGEKVVYVETKYSLPTGSGGLDRVIAQLSNAVEAAKDGDSVILNVARCPTAAEAAKFLSKLPLAVAQNVTIVSGAAQLYNSIKNSF